MFESSIRFSTMILPATTRAMNFVLLTIYCCCSWSTVVYVYGQTFDIGSCPTVPVKTDLDLNQVQLYISILSL